ncbi:unnamed protein product [Vitrella brassicaformis CCMP3155]|uniref:Uncharacterized protein n=2 Tax=Vitrella brassicaformis TaxID=1169539 RepID=A0A0G4FMW3_VITBC|nr:unnamed protein product [Vitrella brassicaformis CCMP3155]|eukprot:CEM15589.1 unnamed protein product [Vitrella brassicaformis CCMP3155]
MGPIDFELSPELQEGAEFEEALSGRHFEPNKAVLRHGGGKSGGPTRGNAARGEDAAGPAESQKELRERVEAEQMNERKKAQLKERTSIRQQLGWKLAERREREREGPCGGGGDGRGPGSRVRRPAAGTQQTRAAEIEEIEEQASTRHDERGGEDDDGLAPCFRRLKLDPESQAATADPCLNCSRPQSFSFPGTAELQRYVSLDLEKKAGTFCNMLVKSSCLFCAIPQLPELSAEDPQLFVPASVQLSVSGPSGAPKAFSGTYRRVAAHRYVQDKEGEGQVYELNRYVVPGPDCFYRGNGAWLLTKADGACAGGNDTPVIAYGARQVGGFAGPSTPVICGLGSEVGDKWYVRTGHGPSASYVPAQDSTAYSEIPISCALPVVRQEGGKNGRRRLVMDRRVVMVRDTFSWPEVVGAIVSEFLPDDRPPHLERCFEPLVCLHPDEPLSALSRDTSVAADIVETLHLESIPDTWNVPLGSIQQGTVPPLLEWLRRVDAEDYVQMVLVPSLEAKCTVCQTMPYGRNWSRILLLIDAPKGSSPDQPTLYIRGADLVCGACFKLGDAALAAKRGAAVATPSSSDASSPVIRETLPPLVGSPEIHNGVSPLPPPSLPLEPSGPAPPPQADDKKGKKNKRRGGKKNRKKARDEEPQDGQDHDGAPNRQLQTHQQHPSAVAPAVFGTPPPPRSPPRLFGGVDAVEQQEVAGLAWEENVLRKFGPMDEGTLLSRNVHVNSNRIRRSLRNVRQSIVRQSHVRNEPSSSPPSPLASSGSSTPAQFTFGAPPAAPNVRPRDVPSVPFFSPGPPNVPSLERARWREYAAAVEGNMGEVGAGEGQQRDNRGRAGHPAAFMVNTIQRLEKTVAMKTSLQISAAYTLAKRNLQVIHLESQVRLSDRRVEELERSLSDVRRQLSEERKGKHPDTIKRRLGLGTAERIDNLGRRELSELQSDVVASMRDLSRLDAAITKRKKEVDW